MATSMTRRLAGFLAGLACWAICGGPAAAAEPQALVVGVEELDYFPNYAIRDGHYAGAARDILDAFAQSAGLRLTYRPLPVKRLYADLFTGTVDLKFPDSPGWNSVGKRGHAIRYSRPVLPYIDGVMVRPDRLGKGLEGFAVLGTVSGFTPFAWLDELTRGKTRLVENAQITGLLKQVSTGRIDGAYVNIAVARYQLRALMEPDDRLVFDPGLPHAAGDYLVSTIRHGAVLDRLDAWLATHRDGVAAIRARYGLEE